MKTVFILQKNKRTVQMIVKMFKELDIDILVFDTWDELGLMFFKKIPDAVLMDWDFEDKSTLDFVRKNTILFPCIFVSACTDPCKIQEALNAGVAEYIMRPFDSSILKSKLRMVNVLEAKK